MQRLKWTVIGTLVIAAVVLGGGTFHAAPGAQAQESDQCVEMVTQAVSAAQEACADTARGQACYGSKSVTATFAGDESPFAASGDSAALDTLQALATSAGDPASGEWGVARLMLPAGLEGDQAVTAILFGDAQLARPLIAEAAGPTLTVTNSGGADVNLRGGAGVAYPVAGVLAPGESLVANGRNAQSDWVRVEIPDGIAWVFTPLVSWDGDLAALPVFEPADVTPVRVSGAPFDVVTLVTGATPATCGAASSGLLLQYTGEQPAALEVNGAHLSFSDATLLLRAEAGARLNITALSGTVTVAAHGGSRDVTAGNSVEVRLGGEDGLLAAAGPSSVQPYVFADAAGAPLALLPNGMACAVGMPAGSQNVALRVGPGTQRGPLANMSPNRSYAVIGWANDPDGAPWWQLDTGSQKSWVAQADVVTVGMCDAVAQVEPPPLVFAAPSAPAEGEGGETVADLAPKANSVWQMYPGTDNMTGDCSGAPAINFCDHLAAISPASGGVMWKGMEASPYYLQQIQPNVYAYSGPNVLGTGKISITLTFTGETTIKMTQSLTLTSEPNCQHVYYYTGEKNW